ncbi:MAG: hypothetical protein JWL80_469 [Parcubacteria group bacterium]|nr:hypothetical protein [Parcubacteria group bacterium]
MPYGCNNVKNIDITLGEVYNIYSKQPLIQESVMRKKIGNTPKYIRVLLVIAGVVSAYLGLTGKTSAQKVIVVPVGKNYFTMPCKEAFSSPDTSDLLDARIKECVNTK